MHCEKCTVWVREREKFESEIFIYFALYVWNDWKKPETRECLCVLMGFYRFSTEMLTLAAIFEWTLCAQLDCCNQNPNQWTMRDFCHDIRIKQQNSSPEWAHEPLKCINHNPNEIDLITYKCIVWRINRPQAFNRFSSLSLSISLYVSFGLWMCSLLIWIV